MRIILHSSLNVLQLEKLKIERLFLRFSSIRMYKYKYNWWFKTVGKGNKERHVAVSDKMLAALKRYRKSRKLIPMPLHGETTPLIHKLIGKGNITSTVEIRRIVQKVFDLAAKALSKDGHRADANTMRQATVHWLRHTGISDDINKRHRPIAYVRDDAGHSSSGTTDRYNDIELKERHASAKDKRTGDFSHDF